MPRDTILNTHDGAGWISTREWRVIITWSGGSMATQSYTTPVRAYQEAANDHRDSPDAVIELEELEHITRRVERRVLYHGTPPAAEEMDA